MILLNKRVGETPLEAITRNAIPRPATYAGRLDPNAEGLLLVLQGDECKQKDSYLGLSKEYDFTLLIGAETDTGDILGLVKRESNLFSTDSLSPDDFLSKIREASGGLIGKHSYPYPKYSSKTVEGTPLFTLARAGHFSTAETEKDIPKRVMEVTALSLDKCELVNSNKILQLIEDRVEKVRGDFRQEAIIERWRAFLPGKTFLLLSGTISCESGTYIRVVLPWLCHRMAQSGCLLALKRTKIGSFLLRDAK